jgi:hypothetical protein
MEIGDRCIRPSPIGRFSCAYNSCAAQMHTHAHARTRTRTHAGRRVCANTQNHSPEARCEENPFFESRCWLVAVCRFPDGETYRAKMNTVSCV